ncbi:MAG: hypothetical protein HZA95_00215 [Candidatus Vogelbacteria bacterium]|nr:hypothetical protein [Candidatus Vogelbacteria bacterium]
MSGLRLGHRLNWEPRLEQGLSLKQEMRLKLRQSLEARLGMQLSLRLELIDSLRGEKYEPKGKCPGCEYRMSNGEIIRGFNQDPTDYTTGCPRCKTRFEPKLVYGMTAAGRVEIPFFCSTQVLAQMANTVGLIRMSPDRIRNEYMTIYHSAIAHYGSLKAAFVKLGREYPFVERDPKKDKEDWKKKIIPFLGRMPDTVVADCAEVSVSVIRRMRKDRKIRCYRARDHADDN